MMYPLLLNPALHTRVWGGRKLANVMHKTLPSDQPYGESWELHDSVTVANGQYAGRTLSDLLSEHSEALVGPFSDPSEGFPLLAKLLDCEDWLSVQVHPDDEQARQLEGEPRGKTEAWVILAADPGARLVRGVKPGTNREAMAEAIRNNTLEDLLVYGEVNQGDVLYVRAGTVHALGPGLLVYEIQQSSDTTYRLYDWGRMGLDGKPRQLHIEKGVQVSNVETVPIITHAEASDVTPIIAGEFFTTYLHEVNGELALDTDGQYFHALTLAEGTLDIVANKGITENNAPVTLQTGQTALIPAALGAYTLRGNGRLLRSLQSA